MAPKSGYRKNTDVRGEYVRLDRTLDAEAKLCAARMGQDYEVWVVDAVQHHLYLCDRFMAHQRYQADELTAAAANRPTPDKNDPRYAVTTPKPTFTFAAGQGSGPTGRNYRP